MTPEEKYEKWKRDEAFARFQKRLEIKQLLAKHKPKKTVKTVSGGLPSLGKRR